ncbi:MAG: hypothetical protein INF44_06410 [Thalassospira sp.]|nr:hypothetical protein [Thalassospira sp.]
MRKLPVFKDTMVVDSRTFYAVDTLSAAYGQYFILLDKEIIEYFQEIECDFYALTDRYNYKSIPFSARKRLFRDLIRFWLGFLQKEGVEAVYFGGTPHSLGEIVLMRACHYLRIPIAFLGYTQINNRSLLRPYYDALPKVPNDYLPGKSTAEITALTDAELLKDVNEDSMATHVTRAANDQFHGQVGANTNDKFLDIGQCRKSETLVTRLKDLIKPLYYKIFSPRSVPVFEIAISLDKDRDLASWRRAILEHRRSALKLKNYHDSLVEENLDLTKPYIYYPMHLQPEMTSQPEAMVFDDHLLALETLLKVLPEGWLIYIKENPRQYDPTINLVSALHFRDKHDLDSLVTRHKDRVRLVPQRLKTEMLIGNCKTVVTLTGTAGWEALNLGKTCLTFAYPWYSPCASCFIVQPPDEVRAALLALADKTPDAVARDRAASLHFYQQALFVGTPSDPMSVSFNTRPYADLLRLHSAELAAYYKHRNSSNIAQHYAA